MEIKKHPWVNQFIDPAENFVKIMSERVEIVSKPIKAEALKVSDKSSHSKAEFSCKSENCNIPDPLKKLMLEYKQKTKKTRKECLNLVHTSSKSSSQDESGVCESDEKPRKIKPVSLNQMANKPPFNPKRSDEDSWSSFSENEDQHQY